MHTLPRHPHTHFSVKNCAQCTHFLDNLTHFSVVKTVHNAHTSSSTPHTFQCEKLCAMHTLPCHPHTHFSVKNRAQCTHFLVNFTRCAQRNLYALACHRVSCFGLVETSSQPDNQPHNLAEDHLTHSSQPFVPELVRGWPRPQPASSSQSADQPHNLAEDHLTHSSQPFVSELVRGWPRPQPAASSQSADQPRKLAEDHPLVKTICI